MSGQAGPRTVGRRHPEEPARAETVPAGGGRAIRVGTAIVVIAVAGFAAIVSYSHIYDLARAHGQSGVAGRLLPLSVDGLIVAASLVMLHEARSGRGAPTLARVMLGLGVAATIGANVAYGAGFGVIGAVISAWPAVAFVGTAELLMVIIQRAEQAGTWVPEPAPVPTDVSGPDALRVRAAALFASDLAAGHTPSIRAIRSRMHVGQPRAQEVRTYLAARTRNSQTQMS